MTTASNTNGLQGPLLTLLTERMPYYCDDAGNLKIADLAAALKMSREGVYRWFRADEISKRGLKRLLQVAAEHEEGLELPNPLTEDELRSFL